VGFIVKIKKDISQDYLVESADINIARLKISQYIPVILAGYKLLFVLALIGLEALILKLFLHPKSPAYDGTYSYLSEVFTPAIYFIQALCFLLSTHFYQFRHTFIEYTRHYNFFHWIPLQIAFFFLIIFSAGKLIPTDFFNLGGAAVSNYRLWEFFLVSSILSTVILSLAIIAPKAYWVNFIKSEKLSLLLSVLFSVAAFVFGSFFQQSWDILGSPTINASRLLLDIVYSDVYVDLHKAILGTQKFTVSIGYQCSGYEGIGMIIVFLACYLMNFKKEFRFAAAFLLFPIGIGVIWIFNCVRIAMLIAIGSSVSPDIAMQGFHSNAGLLSFVGVSMGMIFIVKKINFFTNKNSLSNFDFDYHNFLAVPFLIMLAATLVSSSLSTKFPWLYPIRVITTGVTIHILWSHFELRPTAPKLFAVIGGVIVFVLWIALVPPSIDEDRSFSQSLFSAPTAISISWLILRFFGSVIIVPVAEELAFRGYIFKFFPDRERFNNGCWKIHCAPMLISSILFGALHVSWVAGIGAGIIYYLVKIKSGRVWDAIIAHATTNLLLSAYVLASKHWSYW
jgi:exosortase E/protease (VPEID-CTERM system)